MTYPLPSFAQSIYDKIKPLTLSDEEFSYALAKFVEALGTTCQPGDDVAAERDGLQPWEVSMNIDKIPVAGIPWLGQFVGVTVDATLLEQAQRDQVKHTGGFQRGRPSSIVSALQTTLTGQKSVVFRERDPAPAPTDPAYGLTVITRSSETPNQAASLLAILGQKPAGILLNYQVLPGFDYQGIFQQYATYQQIYNLYGTYQQLLMGTPSVPGTRAIAPGGVFATSTVSGAVRKPSQKPIVGGSVFATSAVSGTVSRQAVAAWVQSVVMAPLFSQAQDTTYSQNITVTRGNFLVIHCFRWAMGAQESLSISDNAGNTYSRTAGAIESVGAVSIDTVVTSQALLTSGTIQVTAALGQARALGMIITEVTGSGIDAIGTGATGASSGATDSIATQTLAATATPNELLVGAYCNTHSSLPFTAGTGLTDRGNSAWNQSGCRIGVETKNVATQGTTPNATWTDSSGVPQEYVAGAVTVKGGISPPGGGGGGTYSTRAIGTYRGGTYDAAYISKYANLSAMMGDLNSLRMPSDLPTAQTLFYRSAISCRPDYDTSIPWSTANANGWLLRDSGGTLLVNAQYSINNILDISNPAVSTALGNNYVTWCNANGWKGVWMDDVVLWCMMLCNALPAGWTQADWHTNIVAHVKRIGTIVKAAGLKLVPNASGYIPYPNPGYDNSDNSVNTYNFWNEMASGVTGFTSEYWNQIADGSNVPYTHTGPYGPGMWDGARTLHQLCNTLGLDFMPFSYGRPDAPGVIFLRASFLLDYNGGNSSFFSGDAPDPIDSPGGAWLKFMGAALGGPINSSGVWTRAYANGTVTADSNSATGSF